MNCTGKIELLHKQRITSVSFRDFLVNMNRLRNEFAHRLGYDLTKNDVHSLIRLAGKAAEVDFSDKIHTLDQRILYEWHTNTAGAEKMFSLSRWIWGSF